MVESFGHRKIYLGFDFIIVRVTWDVNQWLWGFGDMEGALGMTKLSANLGMQVLKIGILGNNLFALNLVKINTLMDTVGRVVQLS